MRFILDEFSLSQWDSTPDRWNIIVQGRNVATYDGATDEFHFISLNWIWRTGLLIKVIAFIQSDEFANRKKKAP